MAHFRCHMYRATFYTVQGDQQKDAHTEEERCSGSGMEGCLTFSSFTPELTVLAPPDSSPPFALPPFPAFPLALPFCLPF